MLCCDAVFSLRQRFSQSSEERQLYCTHTTYDNVALHFATSEVEAAEVEEAASVYDDFLSGWDEEEEEEEVGDEF